MIKPTTEYWAAHLYLSPRQRPKPDQPVRDLSPRAAQRFKKAREELRSLRHVTEQVVYLGLAPLSLEKDIALCADGDCER